MTWALGVTLPVASLGNAQPPSVIPAQYIAKLHTEGLGRAPNQPEWAAAVTFFESHGCSAATLKTAGLSLFTSAEFSRNNPDPESKLLALYRGALNRDADTEGLKGYARALDNGEPFAAIVNEIYGSKELLDNVPAYCNSASPSYGFSSHAAPTPTPGKKGYRGGEAGLQDLLNQAAPGSTVSLAQKAVIPLTSPLKVPPGVTLATYGNPPHEHYTQMARLLRSTTFKGPNVMVVGGGSVKNLWIDGQRNVLGYSKAGGETLDNTNVTTLGGSGTRISENRLTEPQGGTNFFSAGSNSGYPCAEESVTQNLLTGYTTVNGYVSPADGLTMECESLDIEENQIVDMSDIGIVLFSSPHVPQASRVRRNLILSAGNSMNAPISTDPSTGNHGGQSMDYTGTILEENLFWTGPYTAFDFGIEAGAREYFPLRENSDGRNAFYLNNTTGTLGARVHAGIAIAGMLNVTLRNDADHPLNFELVPFPPGRPSSRCPAGAVIAEKTAGHASGAFPPATVDRDFDGCI